MMPRLRLIRALVSVETAAALRDPAVVSWREAATCCEVEGRAGGRTSHPTHAQRCDTPDWTSLVPERLL